MFDNYTVDRNRSWKANPSFGLADALSKSVRGNTRGGSRPSLSAICSNGVMAERLMALAWKAGRGNTLGGSNPSDSALHRSFKPLSRDDGEFSSVHMDGWQSLADRARLLSE